MLDDVSSLLLIAGNPDLDGDERLHALMQLAAFYAEETPIEALESLYRGDPFIRLYLVASLALLGARAPIALLRRALADEEASVGEAAAISLAHLGAREAIPDLVRVSQPPHDWVVRRVALRALGELGAIATLPVLLATLHDPDAALRAAAVYALGELGEASVVPSLLPCLHDTVWVVGETLHALAKLRSACPPDLLVPFLAHADYRVRLATVHALVRYGDDAPRGDLALALCDPHVAVRRAASMALRALDA